MTAPPLPADDDARRLIGAALARISSFRDAPSAALAHRIADDLGALAAHPGCGDGLRLTCGTLRAQWAARCLRIELGLERSDRRAGRGAPRPH
jgi:hypothetical protein